MTNDSTTTLHEAATKNSAEVAKLLIANSADIISTLAGLATLNRGRIPPNPPNVDGRAEKHFPRCAVRGWPRGLLALNENPRGSGAMRESVEMAAAVSAKARELAMG